MSSLYDAYLKIYQGITPANADPASKIIFTPDRMAQLHEISEAIPGIDWSKTRLAESTRKYLSNLSPNYEDVTYAFNKNGYCVISLPGFSDQYGEAATKRALMTLLSNVGEQFGAYKKKGLWQTLGVDKSKQSLRAESMGYIPFHMDFTQATNPPSAISLYALRSDPAGGGENLVFNYRDYFNGVGAAKKEQLARLNVSYSVLYDTDGLGELFNPHPLLEVRGNAPYLRYDGKAFPQLPDDEARLLYMKLEREFIENSQRVKLDSGDMIIIDQSKALHARLPLHETQGAARPPADQDRFLYEMYILGNPS